MSDWKDAEMVILVRNVKANMGHMKTGESMMTKWSKKRDKVYSDDNGLPKDVENYQWEALKYNYNKRAKQLYTWSQDPKSNWSSAPEESKKWEEEMLDGYEEELQRAEGVSERTKASALSEQRHLQKCRKHWKALRKNF